MWNSASFNYFKESILKFFRFTSNSISLCHKPTGKKYLTWLRVNFNHLRECKFKHSSHDTFNPLFTCSLEPETTNRFLLYSLYIFLTSIRSIKSNILYQNDNNIVKTLLHGLDSVSKTQNTSILNATMEFLISFNCSEKQQYMNHMNG